MNPFELVDWTGGFWHSSQFPDTIHGFCFDARQIEPGQCFVALSGGARDGHDFCEQAVNRGACAVMVERTQVLDSPQLVVENTLQAMGSIARRHRERFSGKVIGVTGSCGKTSTKEMLRRILGMSRTHATAGNWNNLIGVPMTLFGLDAKQHDYAVVEAGINQPGEMAQLGAMIQPDLSVLTMIGAAHLELLGSLSGVAEEKSWLMSQTRGPIVLPVEALAYPAFRQLANRCIVLAAEGVQVPKGVRDCVRYDVSSGVSGTTRLHQDGHDYTVHSPSVGIVQNAALAIAAAEVMGIAADQIKTGIEAWRPEGNRGGIATHGEQTFYIDCYNANPASMLDAMAAFRSAMPETFPRCYVLGVMNELGQGATELHQQVGAALQLRAQDHACFVGPELLRNAYVSGALDAGAQSKQLHVAEKCEAIHSFVAQFEGKLFLKGSRSYALENLLPPELK